MNTKPDCGVSLQIDDYLDLLHFAIQIQDQEWQQSLIHQLKVFQPAGEHQQQRSPEEELWTRLDHINSKLTGLCNQLHAAHSKDEREKFEARIGLLQVQRVEVARKIKWASRRT
ncbi:hypothetical protein ASD24_17590 [Paenibacillus sp. Root52]|uniref:Uncharacterized protein n=1 Tax=Paenibacillus amylolyticus TaxID=1451 RepID=A0AAP5LQ04_PAEAM|nr:MULTISPECIES: hypothetical protein [Paenibacillus]KQY80741.1 hypothetical protein ASD24_17590 [Paenibacillus sp. Root52]MDR6724983.1 hypothetical protein [Paenibacillus amylolyticus]